MIGVSYGSIYEFRSLGKPITTPLRDWKPEFIDNSINQDDIYVEMTFLKTLDTHGPRATHEQAGVDFRDSKYRLWHANMAARTNLRAGIMPPQSGHPRYNPHADDIDFQIEADVFGLIAPGMPQGAARMCDVFGSIMNFGDGLYGGRFVAAMYCQAYLEADPTPAAVMRCVEAGLGSIPADSGYARILRDVIEGHRRYPDDWLKTWQILQDKYGEDDLCPDGYQRPFNIDAKLNGAYIALGLLYGQADFAKTLEITTRCGQDADCNPSNSAGVLGALYGYERIPAAFTSGIPALTGRKFEYTDYDYPQLIQVCERVVRRVLQENGGRVVTRNGAEVMEIPAQKPSAPAKLEQMRSFSLDEILQWRGDFEKRRRASLAASIPIEQWSPGWKLLAVGPDMDPGVRSFLGRPNVLITHPVSEQEPAVLERMIDVPAVNPRLLLTVTSFPSQADADWELRLLIDDKPLSKAIIRSPGKWQDISYDLGAYAGRRVTLRLENAAGGARSWAWEAGYWAEVKVVGG